MAEDSKNTDKSDQDPQYDVFLNPTEEEKSIIKEKYGLEDELIKLEQLISDGMPAEEKQKLQNQIDELKEKIKKLDDKLSRAKQQKTNDSSQNKENAVESDEKSENNNNALAYDLPDDGTTPLSVDDEDALLKAETDGYCSNGARYETSKDGSLTTTRKRGDRKFYTDADAEKMILAIKKQKNTNVHISGIRGSLFEPHKPSSAHISQDLGERLIRMASKHGLTVTIDPISRQRIEKRAGKSVSKIYQMGQDDVRRMKELEAKKKEEAKYQRDKERDNSSKDDPKSSSINNGNDDGGDTPPTPSGEPEVTSTHKKPTGKRPESNLEGEYDPSAEPSIEDAKALQCIVSDELKKVHDNSGFDSEKENYLSWMKDAAKDIEEKYGDLYSDNIKILHDITKDAYEAYKNGENIKNTSNVLHNMASEPGTSVAQSNDNTQSGPSFDTKKKQQPAQPGA